MKDNELLNLVADSLEQGLALQGSPFLVIAKQQPTQQGAPTPATVYIEKLYDTTLGMASLSLEYDEILMDWREIRTQQIMTTYQISSLVIQNTNDLSIPTASDLTKLARAIMVSDWFIRKLKANDVNILKPTEIRNPYFIDDKQRAEAHANFDVTFTHTDVLTFTVPNASVRTDNSGIYHI